MPGKGAKGAGNQAFNSKGTEDFEFHQFCRPTRTLMGVRDKGLTLKDVKNEGRSGDVYENKGNSDKMPDQKTDISA
jgi:hypothetical protein